MEVTNYSIALIQNQSEMLRYSYADIRSFLTTMNFRVVLYTSENILQLKDCLARNEVDALFIASNACNDQDIRAQLDAMKESIGAFLQNNKGLIIMHQMRMTTMDRYGFLPDEFTVRSVDRKTISAQEHSTDGDIVVNAPYESHILLRYPHVVDIAGLKQRCLTSAAIAGIYWHYIQPIRQQVYFPILIDRFREQVRPLLLVSQGSTHGRIVISSLTLDWHRQVELLENIVNYAVIGPPTVAVVRKSNQASLPFRFLLANLMLSKIPHRQYVQDELSLVKIPEHVHELVILDTAWSETEIELAISEYYGADPARTVQDMALLHFSSRRHGKTSVISIGGASAFKRIRGSALAWVSSSFKSGLWDGSFWATIDVLQNLRALGENIDRYLPPLLDYANRHNVDGSYDEVFGASCALLWLHWVRPGPTSPQFRQTLEWIERKVGDCDLYERALAYDVFKVVGIRGLSTGQFEKFREEVIRAIGQETNELQLYRYARTLAAYAYWDDASRLVSRLRDLQRSDGSWIDVSTTAGIVNLMIELRSKRISPGPDLEEMIFHAMVYLRQCYDERSSCWSQKASATSSAIKAWQAFDEMLKFPIDEVLASIRSVNERYREIISLQTSVEAIAKLEDELAAATVENERLSDNSRTIVRLAGIGWIVAVGVTLYAVGLLIYLGSRDLMQDAHGVMVKEWISARVLVVLSVLLGVSLLMKIVDMLGWSPPWLVFAKDSLSRALGLRLETSGKSK